MQVFTFESFFRLCQWKTEKQLRLYFTLYYTQHPFCGPSSLSCHLQKKIILFICMKSVCLSFELEIYLCFRKIQKTQVTMWKITSFSNRNECVTTNTLPKIICQHIKKFTLIKFYCAIFIKFMQVVSYMWMPSNGFMTTLLYIKGFRQRLQMSLTTSTALFLAPNKKDAKILINAIHASCRCWMSELLHEIIFFLLNQIWAAKILQTKTFINPISIMINSLIKCFYFLYIGLLFEP